MLVPALPPTVDPAGDGALRLRWVFSPRRTVDIVVGPEAPLRVTVLQAGRVADAYEFDAGGDLAGVPYGTDRP